MKDEPGDEQKEHKFNNFPIGNAYLNTSLKRKRRIATFLRLRFRLLRTTLSGSY